MRRTGHGENENEKLFYCVAVLLIAGGVMGLIKGLVPGTESCSLKALFGLARILNR